MIVGELIVVESASSRPELQRARLERLAVLTVELVNTPDIIIYGTQSHCIVL